MRYRVLSPLMGVVNSLTVKVGDHIDAKSELVIVEAMKMETAILSEHSGQVTKIQINEGDVVNKGDILVEYEIATESSHEKDNAVVSESENAESNYLQELLARKEFLKDKNRPAAVAKRRKKNQNTARENVALLVDADSFLEYGGLTIAAQRVRRTVEDLIKNTPADGLVGGIATINKDIYQDHNTKCAILAYDYTVLAGTQGTMNHLKMDRVLAVADKENLPVVLFGEGGGGRPGDVDQQTIAGLHIHTFVNYAGIENLKIAIVSGYCFAGNAALVGSSDIIIATRNISMGMGGPAMIEGGGLGTFHPRDVGPASIHLENGVIDVLVEDETEGIQKAKQLLGYIQGPKPKWKVSNQQALRNLIPENRKRVYDMRNLIITLADVDSVQEVKPAYGKGIITSFVRIEGQPYGLIANNPEYMSGAITSENACKACDFLELCNRFELSIISLVDTPGIMVGPEAEKSGTVRHASKLFNVSARLNVPMVAIVVRRAYGLGAMAMMGGSTHSTACTIAWPTGEFGAMGLEGAVQLGFRKELEAIKDPEKREQTYKEMVAEAYERGKAISMATMLEIDDVIDPASTRSWITGIVGS